MKQEHLTPLIDDLDNWFDLPLHELCTIFPAMRDDDYDGLVASMKDQGFLLSDPIVLVDLTPDAPNSSWAILDGRNRHLAAMDAGVEPEFMVYSGENPIGFVTSRNLDRRHLTTGQKAAVAAELAGLNNGQNSTEGEVTQSEAAERVGVGEATLRRYKYVEKHDPELATKVKAGEVPLEKARSIVKDKVDQPPAVEDVIADAIPKSLGEKRAARKAAERAELQEKLEAIAEKVAERSPDAAPKSALLDAALEGYKLGRES